MKSENNAYYKKHLISGDKKIKNTNDNSNI